MALLAIAVATNPDEQHFVKFVQEYTQRGLGFLPGALLAKPTVPVKTVVNQRAQDLQGKHRTWENPYQHSHCGGLGRRAVCIPLNSHLSTPGSRWSVGCSIVTSGDVCRMHEVVLTVGSGAGFAASSLLWLQMKGGAGPVFYNFWAFSIARCACVQLPYVPGRLQGTASEEALQEEHVCQTRS